MADPSLMTTNFIERTECPCCGGCSLQVLYRAAFDTSPVKEYLEGFYSPQGGVDLAYLRDGFYHLVECSDCSLIFQKQILNDDLMSKLYGSWIDPDIVFLQDFQQTGPERYAALAREIEKIIILLGKTPSSLRMLDFGMGWAQWARMAKAFGCDAYGVELCNRRIAVAKADGIKVIIWDEIPLQQFDFINTEQVFEHLPKPLETLFYLKRALKPGGFLKISVPTAHNIEQRVRRMDWGAPKGTRYSLNPVAPLEHINFFRKKSLLKMTSIAGLKEVHIPMRTQFQYLTSWFDAWSVAMKLLQPMRRVLMSDQYYGLFRHV